MNSFPDQPKGETLVSDGAVRCCNCGREAFVQVPYRDVCPTDRGDEVREGVEWLCVECAEDLGA